MIFNDSYFKVKTLTPYKENDVWYLDVVGELEERDGQSEVHIPKLELGLCNILREETNWSPCEKNNCYGYTKIDLGFGELPARKGKSKYSDSVTHGIIYEKKRIEKEMTLEEVEKELGYKVKLVTNK